VRKILIIIFSVICTLLFWDCTWLYADTFNGSAEVATTPDEKNNYILNLVILIRDGKFTVVGESSCSSVTVSVKNDGFEKLVKTTADVINDRFEWSTALSKFTSGSIYYVTVTDTEGHIANDTVTIPTPIESIEFADIKSNNLEVGKSVALNVKVTSSGEQNQTIKYYSSDNSVVTVTSSGKITGHKPGKVTITATCGNARADVELNIYVKTTKIELNESYITMQPNESFQINAKVFPEAAEQKCTYESTNENVITVNDSGKITAKESGVATVLVSNGDALETVTVIVNNAADAKSDDAVQTSGNSNVEEGHIENSQLAAMIHSSGSKEIVISNEDLRILDASALYMLKSENRNLVFDKETYVILINGREIVNPLLVSCWTYRLNI